MSQWIYDKFSSTSFKQRLWKRKWFWYYIFILTKYVWHCGAVVKDLLARPDEPSSTPGDADFCYFVLFLFFSCLVFFFNTQSFSLVFLYSYCPPCWSRTFINIYFKLKLGEFYFKSSWSAYWPSLRPEKKHKLSRHVPPLKQLYFSLDVSWHPWQTTHSTDTTNCTNLH